MKKYLQNFFVLPLILFVSIAIVVFLVKTKTPIEHQEAGYPVKAVEVITAEKIPFRARAMAFGNVEPAVLLNTKSEVSGKVSFMHADLKKGASLPKDTVVLRIEPTTFEFSLTESKAALVNSQSSLAQLKVEEKSAKDALAIVQKNLNVELKEQERIKALKDKGIISQSALDKEKQKVLALRQQLQDIEGKLASFASRRNAIKAQIKQSKSQVDKSQDTLGRTEVRLPFDARIGAVSVEKGEFVQAGSMLFEALGIQAVEINAHLSTRQFRPLVTGLRFIEDARIDLQEPVVLQAALSSMNLEARVRLVGDNSQLTVWDGTLLYLSESVDPTRDTLGLVVAVDKPYEGIIPGKRPPLLKGMYTSVEFFAPVRPALVLPRKAVHQGRVYVATDENTLSIRPVNILFTQGDMVVLAGSEDAGLKTGEKVIISDVVPVMEGMPLKVIPAVAYAKQLRQTAVGDLNMKSDLKSDTGSQ
ncbi:MAG: HlyD family secretion protein [Gammaproteobacteria bacterium]|nr:HlyD family secretion protein [Gammaproteobacteria bacterium]